MLDPVTSRYAEALFGLAKRNGVLDAVRSDVDRLSTELSSESVGSFFFDARIPIEDRRSRIEPFLSGVHEYTRSFVHLLFDKRREDVLKNLGAAFHRRMLDERGEAEGVVESARPLGAAEISNLAVTLGARLGRRVSLENKVNPEVVGGVRVIVGSKMVDGSLSGRMERLRKLLLDAPLPSLQDA